jgi:hypothetical protein
LEFEWNEKKNLANREKHGITFDEAALIFEGPTVTRIDDRKDYGEIRTISIGKFVEKVVVTVIHTTRDGRIRIISARLANRIERKKYNVYCSKIT